MRRILRIPYTAHRTNESVWKEITDTRASVSDHKEEKIAMVWSSQPFNRTGQTDNAGVCGGRKRHG